MSASRCRAVGPQLVAIALIGLSTAGCSDSGRFSDISSSSDDSSRGSDVAGSGPQNAAANYVDSRPMPILAGDTVGTSGGGHGVDSYRPGGEVTSSLPTAPLPPAWTWEGGRPIIVAPGETLETLSQRYGVPVAGIMEANSLTSPAMVHPGQHLVIPRWRGPVAAASPQTRIASSAPAVSPVASVGPPRTALSPTGGVHVVAPGETLHGIARLYGTSALALAKANNIAPDTTVKVGERIVIPGARVSAPIAAAAPPPAPRTEAAAAPSAESQRAARVGNSAPAAQESPVKTAEPAGGLPSFRWPVRGRIIAGFGPKPNGLQNDGINLAVPEGTPIKAAEDGVVAYAGDELKGYGNLVLVRHSNGFVTAYAHASEILVKRGETVKRGATIAKSGQTGNVTSPQLHFEIRKGATPVDPSQYLNGA
jgi:murein DD-endopeptidase MepM/ murein hydrolase activator NlpD